MITVVLNGACTVNCKYTVRAPSYGTDTVQKLFLTLKFLHKKRIKMLPRAATDRERSMRELLRYKYLQKLSAIILTKSLLIHTILITFLINSSFSQ